MNIKGLSLLAPCAALIFAPVNTAIAEDQPVLVKVRRMSLDIALAIAKTALENCRNQGYQVGVTVVDRAGHAQVVLRDVLAMDLTLEISYQKAYTAMTFTRATSSMEGLFAGSYSIGKVDKVLLAAGGLPIQASGETVGGIGVSGAPSGEIDEGCARAGVAAAEMDLEMAPF